MRALALLTLLLTSSCALTHGADCEDARERLYELSCLEGYEPRFCEIADEAGIRVDAACVVDANSCTEAREGCYR